MAKLNKSEQFAKIAKNELLIDTLQVRNRDSLDFHEVHVGMVQKALEAAFKLGFSAGKRSTRPKPSRPW